MTWLKKHSKKIMAVLGAVLMVTFLIQPNSNGVRSRGRGSPIAYMGKLALYADEKSSAAREFEMLEQSYRTDVWETRHQFASPLQELGNGLQMELRQHPELFLILSKEAEQRGISINNDIVRTAIENRIRPFSMQFTSSDPLYTEAVKRLLMIVALRDQLNSNVKISDPQWNHVSADMMRRMRLNYVEYSAPTMAAHAPAPTTQQVTEFFEESRNVPPGLAKSTKNELHFGYQVPNRVKLQYVTIPADQVLKAAREARATAADKPGELPYDLKVEAYQYWLEHQSEFMRPAENPPATQSTPTTQPAIQSAAATQPSTTQPAMAVATQPAGPTTRPFAEVLNQIVASILKTKTDELSDKVAAAVREKMSADWQTFHAAHPNYHPATAPTTAPAVVIGPTTSQSTDFDAYGYLEELRADIQRRFNVSIEVSEPAGWKTTIDLSNLSGIGSSSTGKEAFSAYAARDTAPFITDPAAKATAIGLLQPSDVLKDAGNNQYIFRLTDASPAHAPDLSEMMARVQEDTKLKIGYELANAAATKLFEAAKKDGLGTAAKNSGQAVISTGMFDTMSVSYTNSIQNFQHSEEAVQAVLAKANELVAEASDQNPHPLGIVQIPGEKIVLVVELGGVSTPNLTALGSLRLRTSAQEEAMAVEPISESYFNYDAIVKRVGYKVADKEK